MDICYSPANRRARGKSGSSFQNVPEETTQVKDIKLAWRINVKETFAIGASEKETVALVKREENVG